MRSITGVFVGALLVGAALGGSLWYEHMRAQRQGGVYIGVTDATADISGVSDIDLSIRKVELHREGGGWVTLDSHERTYGLLSLKADGTVAQYARADVEAGSYDRVRVTFGAAMIRMRTGSTLSADLPGRVLVANLQVPVKAGSDTHLQLDLLADRSLHLAQAGRYLFAPVAEITVREDAVVNVASDDTMMLSGGTEHAPLLVGMDLNGTSREGFALTTDGTLSIEDRPEGPAFVLGGLVYASLSSQPETSVSLAASAASAAEASVGAATTSTAAELSGVELQVLPNVR